jgi:hypothetical protein
MIDEGVCKRKQGAAILCAVVSNTLQKKSEVDRSSDEAGALHTMKMAL